MTETNHFAPMNPSEGDVIKVLNQDGTWVKHTYRAGSWRKDGPFQHRTTARRAFVNLAEAVRRMGSENETRLMLEALAGLHVEDQLLSSLLVVYGGNLEEDAYSEDGTPNREAMARSFASILDGQEKFDVARFMHHATSDSTADDDGESGKWSFNRLNPEGAQKTTIEAVGEDGESSETVIM
jgi:hypothetical protein